MQMAETFFLFLIYFRSQDLKYDRFKLEAYLNPRL